MSTKFVTLDKKRVGLRFYGGLQRGVIFEFDAKCPNLDRRKFVVDEYKHRFTIDEFIEVLFKCRVSGGSNQILHIFK
jgi:hypothetical protein